MNKWYQIWVSHPTADSVALMKRCDPILQRFGALPAAPDGTPIKSTDGTIEVRVYSGSVGLGMAKSYLQDQGFIVEREQEND